MLNNQSPHQALTTAAIIALLTLLLFLSYEFLTQSQH